MCFFEYFARTSKVLQANSLFSIFVFLKVLIHQSAVSMAFAKNMKPLNSEKIEFRT